MHMYEAILTMKQYPGWVMHGVKYLELKKKDNQLNGTRHAETKRFGMSSMFSILSFLPVLCCSATNPYWLRLFPYFTDVQISCHAPLKACTSVESQQCFVQTKKNHQLTHAVCFPSPLLSAHYPFCTNGIWVFTSAVQLLKHFTKKLSSDTEEKVQNPSYPSYLSTDGGPPLSLKRCRGQSQGGDGWGESLPVA